MEIRRFGLELSDYQLIDKWLHGHGVPQYAQEPFPEYTLIAFHEGTPIAMLGFRGIQYIGIVDWLVTNPEAPSHLRSQAINELEANIEAHAKDVGISVLIAWTSHKSVKNRMEALGWVKPKVFFRMKDLRS